MTAFDSGNPPRSTAASVYVKVININDERPVFTTNKYQGQVMENSKVGTNVTQVKAVDPDGDDFEALTYSLHGNHHYLTLFAIDAHDGVITTSATIDREENAVVLLEVQAHDGEFPTRFVSTATVNIIIGDENDNDPVWIYPTAANSTIDISNAVPVGYRVAATKATDADYDESNRITYVITSGNAQNYFSCDTNTGVIATAKSLLHITYEQFALTLEASDGSDSSARKASSQLLIRVNSSIDYHLPLGATKRPLYLAGNFILIASLTCSCVLLTVILIIVILVIRRKERKKTQRRYNCRMEALLKAKQQQQQQLKDKESVSLMDDSPVSTLNRAYRAPPGTVDAGCGACAEMYSHADSSYRPVSNGTMSPSSRAGQRQGVKVRMTSHGVSTLKTT